MMKFWVKQADQDQWDPAPAEGLVLPADVYSVIAQSPQPFFTITVDLRQYALSNGSSSEDPKAELLRQQQSIRTNEEGIGVILPPTSLSPGIWELRCQDSDLIAELFGEGKSDRLRLEVIPSATSAKDLGGAISPTIPPLIQVKAIEARRPRPVRTNFSLLHTRLQGNPGEVLMLTGRFSRSGELEARLFAHDQLVFEGQRTIQFPAEAKTAVFSIPIPLPSAPWSGDLLGSLTLHPADRDTVEPDPTIGFTVRCLPSDLTSSEEMTSLIPLRASQKLRGLHSPHASKAPQEMPLSQFYETLATDPPEILPPGSSLFTPPDPALPDSTPLPEWSVGNRTLQKMLQFCLADPVTDTAFSPTKAQWPLNLLDTSPVPEIEMPELLNEPSIMPEPEFNPELSTGTESSEIELSEIELSETELAAPDPLPLLDLTPPVILETEPEPEAEPELDAQSSDPDWLIAEAAELMTGPSDEASNFEAGIKLPSFRRVPEPEPSRVGSQLLAFSLEPPEIRLPDQIRSGERLDIILRLVTPDLVSLSAHPAPPLWIKLWVKHGKTRALIDGPRWLLDFTLTDQGVWQTITRMSVPFNLTELIFEAWTVTPDLLHQSPHTVLKRLIR